MKQCIYELYGQYLNTCCVDVRFHDGLEIKPGGKYRITEDGNKSQLVVKGVTPDEAGDFTCELSNPKGKDSASAKLTVQSNFPLLVLFLLGMYQGQFFTEYRVPSNKTVFCRVRVPSSGLSM